MRASAGRTVMYTLSQQDAEEVNRRRDDFETGMACALHIGYQGHVGDPVHPRDVLPAVVIAVYTNAIMPDLVDLRVLLPGNDVLWAPLRPEGTRAEDTAVWNWPVISHDAEDPA